MMADPTTKQEELFEPDRFAWMKGAPLWHTIAGNTFGHYQEHTEIIETWLHIANDKRN